MTLVLPACHRAPPPPSNTGGGPADRLAPGEAPPGTLKAWDLVLPRGARIDGTFPDEIDAHVALPSEAVANYLRSQAEEAQPTATPIVGASGTVFPEMHVKGAARDHHLRVTVTDEGTSTRIAVTRIAEAPLPAPSVTGSAAMEKAGLSPNGALLDPDHKQ